MDLTRNYFQRNSSWNAPYTFSGKEKDEETGYGYVKKLRFFSSLSFGNEKQVFHYAHCLRRFGARYYDSGLSLWLSVDPMSDKYPSISPYNYCANNPVILVDPDGRELEPIVGLDGELLGCTREGWKGKPIVMDKKDYKDGISKDQALEKGTSLDEYGKGIKISDKTWKSIENNGGERMLPSLSNNSNKTVFYKPEGKDKKTGIDLNPGYDATGAYPVGPKMDLYAPIDGIKTSKMGSDEVFKVPDGFRCEVWSDGTPNITNFPVEKMLSVVKRGSVIKTPDAGWNKLRNCLKK